MIPRVGYLTGTFDTFHEAHIRFLQRARTLCDSLIVGVTTDEVAGRQKRVPLLPFEQRRAVVEACRYVDAAVEHHGFSKEEDYERLRFDILFSGAEYKESEEFRNYDKTEVVFLPRQTLTSSTTILNEICLRYTDQMKVIAIGVQGHPIYRLGSMVIKEIRVTGKEIKNTADVHNLGFPRPRNWKTPGAKQEHPNIPGVNPNREILITKLLPPRSWNPFIDVIQKYSDSKVEIYWVVQRFAGNTLASLWNTLPEDKRASIMGRVSAICQELKAMDVVHGDIHLNNICADEDNVLSLIDFGWNLHPSFDICKLEREEMNVHLQKGFDFSHFRESVKWFENGCK
jgi:glycerol-3-phosphate cytidylyltransferase